MFKITVTQNVNGPLLKTKTELTARLFRKF